MFRAFLVFQGQQGLVDFLLEFVDEHQPAHGVGCCFVIPFIVELGGEVSAHRTRVREQALRVGRDYCRNVGLQMLDETVSRQRSTAAPALSQAVTEAMQELGMKGGRFEVALTTQSEPQAFGLENIEFLVAGHAGSTPRPLGKVASGGELSRLALAIAVTTSQRSDERSQVGTLIFDEIDSGVGGAVADTVGRLMQRLGRDRQVMAVTHLAQVAACAQPPDVGCERGKRCFQPVREIGGAVDSALAGLQAPWARLEAACVAHLESLLAQLPLGLAMADRDGRLLFANAAAPAAAAEAAYRGLSRATSHLLTAVTTTATTEPQPEQLKVNTALTAADVRVIRA